MGWASKSALNHPPTTPPKPIEPIGLYRAFNLPPPLPKAQKQTTPARMGRGRVFCNPKGTTQAKEPRLHNVLVLLSLVDLTCCRVSNLPTTVSVLSRNYNKNLHVLVVPLCRDDRKLECAVVSLTLVKNAD